MSERSFLNKSSQNRENVSENEGKELKNGKEIDNS